MDELELLKKDWQSNRAQDEPRLTGKEIYPMLHKKSSSIVKTLYYISIAELIFWILINSYPYFSSEKMKSDLETMYGSSTTFIALTVFSYAVIVLFVYLLYTSYKSISVTDNSKKLMESIIKTRKVIKYYVLYNLIIAFLSLAFTTYYMVFKSPEFSEQFANFSDKQMLVAALMLILMIGVFVLVIWIFYRIIYGILLRRLNRNYRELKKLEV